MGTLTERKRVILFFIIENYISNGKPISSSLVAEKSGLPFSPATIRNEMAELEEEGYLFHPHPSAGSVPSDKGFRYFVSNLVSFRPVSKTDRELIVNRCELEGLNPDSLIRKLSETLSEISKHMGFVSSYGWEQVELKRIQFFLFGEKKIGAIFILKGGMVEHRLLKNEWGLTPREIVRINNFLNQNLAGKSLLELRLEIFMQTQRDNLNYDRTLAKLRELSDKLLLESSQREIYMSGEANLLLAPELSAQADQLKKAIQNKKLIMELLDQAVKNPGLKVVIGDENPVPEMKKLSLIISDYSALEGKIKGTIGIMGPVRMDYERLIPLVNFSSKLVSEYLSYQ